MKLKGILYYQYAIFRYTSIVFWSILFSFLLLGIVISKLIGNAGVYYNISIPVYVFLSVIGYWSVKNLFPYLIKVGCSRKNIFIGTGIGFILFIILFNLFSNMLLVAGNTLFGWLVEKNTHFMGHFIEFFIPDHPMWLMLLVDVSISSLFVTVCLFFGLLFYHYGLLGGFSSLAFLILVVFISGPKLLASEKAYQMGQFVIEHPVYFFSGLFCLALIIYGITYFITKKIQIQ